MWYFTDFCLEYDIIRKIMIVMQSIFKDMACTYTLSVKGNTFLDNLARCLFIAGLQRDIHACTL